MPRPYLSPSQTEASSLRPFPPVIQREADDAIRAPLRMWSELRSHLRALLGEFALTEDQHRQLGWHVRFRRYRSGQVIAAGGDRAGLWALVVHGQVSAQAKTGTSGLHLLSGRRHPSSVLAEGSTFGEEMLLHGVPSRCTYRAATEVELLLLRRSDLLHVVGEEAPARRLTRRATAPPRKAVWAWPAAACAFLIIVALALFVSGAWRNPSGRKAESLLLPEQGSGSIRITYPANGSVLMRQEVVQVAATMQGTSFHRLDLLVDGRVAATHVLTDQDVGDREIHVAWNDCVPGSHTLTLRAGSPEGAIVSSGPVVSTIVPAGRLVFSSNRNGVDAVFEMATDGSLVHLLTRGPGACRQPAPRPDGALVFVTDEGALGSRLRLMPTASMPTRNLFPGRDPAWALDGGSLAFARSVDGVSQVHVAKAPEWSVQQLTAGGTYAGQPSWSPDGTRVAYVAEHERNLDVWVSRTGEGKATRLTSDPATDWAPAWSPDGDSLAFVSNRSGKPQIYIMEVYPDAPARQVTHMALGAEAPAWSPDGYWLAFVGYGGDGAGINGRELFLVRASGSDVVRLTDNAYDDMDPTWLWQ